MTPRAGSDYLQTEVLTATPQRLQLMLIEAAIRSVSNARQCHQSGDKEAAFSAVLRAQRIVTELLTALRPEPENELVARVAAVYLFIYRSLVAANLHHSLAKLDDALRVLEAERETWRIVCEQLGSEHHANAAETSLMGTSFEA